MKLPSVVMQPVVKRPVAVMIKVKRIGTKRITGLNSLIHHGTWSVL